MEQALLRVASVLLCLVFHEVSHGIVAYALGDPTAKRSRRLSLNPLHHIDWIGLASMLFVGVGWAKPVPVDPRYFKKPKQGMAITALAGPVSNFLLALIALAALKVNVYGGREIMWMSRFLLRTALLSVGLGLFNLIPVPPLDGSKILAVCLPNRAYGKLMRYERFGMPAVIALMMLPTTNTWLNSAILWVFNLLGRIVGL